MPSIKVKKLTIGGRSVRCAGQRGNSPQQLTLIATGATVTATCGRRHAPKTTEKNPGRQPMCFFEVEGLPSAQLATIAQAEERRPFRIKRSAGVIAGVFLGVASNAPATSSTASAAAAIGAKSGKGGGAGAPSGPAKPAGRATGGAMTAAFGAVAAVAGAAGQVATAGASAVESAASLGREGIGAARDGIREAGAYGERRHERKMRDGAGDDQD
ncbi:hypothetical protein [Streptomyces formicae]